MLQPKSTQTNNSEPRMPYDINIRNVESSNSFNESSSNYAHALNEYKSDLITYFEEEHHFRYENKKVFNDPFGKHCANQTMCYGFKCIDELTECYGDNRDALYSGPGQA